MKKRNTLFMGVFAAFLTGMIYLAGCGTDTVTPTTTKANPDVRIFDSLYVAENVTAASYSGLDLFNGKTVLRDDPTKDVQLVDTNGSGSGFYLRSGDLSVNMVGTATRFQRMYSDLTQAQFDTISVFSVGHDPIVASDFTSDDSRGGSGAAWGYFDGLSTRPVYCVWLKGKHDNGTTAFDDYAIIQPESMVSGPATGTYMIFRVRTNVAGKNDFRRLIPAN